MGRTQDRRVSRPHYLYRLFDADGSLIYVGITGRPDVRLSAHRRGSPWWPLIDETRTTITEHESLAAARRAEVVAIAWELPRMNTSPGGDGRDPRDLTQDRAERLLNSQAEHLAARARYRAEALAAVEASSFAVVSELTGLSTNTLQRWKREASNVT